MIRKIATAAVYVEDQSKAVSFWTKQVGFTVRREEGDGVGIEVGPTGAESCLVIYPKSITPDWAERKPSIVFECEDVEATFEGMRQRGVSFTQKPRAMRWGVFAIFLDGEGNLYGLREAADSGIHNTALRSSPDANS